MSHVRVKTEYNTEGPHGSVEKKTLYAHHNLSNDYVTYYDDNGEWLITIPDTINDNVLDAIMRLYTPKVRSDGDELRQKVLYMTPEDLIKCNI